MRNEEVMGKTIKIGPTFNQNLPSVFRPKETRFGTIFAEIKAIVRLLAYLLFMNEW
jgi:hypothetical protein